MNRRAFVAGSVACLATPRVAEAQQAGKVARVGLLSVGPAVPSEEIATSPLLTSLIAGQNMAARHRLPTMFPGARTPVEAGGLMSYGHDYPPLFRRAAWYIDRILRGTKPMDLPVE